MLNDIDDIRQVRVSGGILNRGGIVDLNRGSVSDERLVLMGEK